MADVLGPQLFKLLQEKVYDKRKTAALEVERIVREALHELNEGEKELFKNPNSVQAAANTQKWNQRITSIIQAIVNDFAYSLNQNARNGGLTALAAVSIALGPVEAANRIDQIVPPILSGFEDADIRVRYYACESMYNVGKVVRRDILKFFNEIFDALSKLVADPDPSVKNGAELLDRLIKDIVCENAAYFSQVDESINSYSVIKEAADENKSGAGEPSSFPSEPAFPPTPGSIPIMPMQKPSSFNFKRFIPLLSERIRSLNPFTRMFLVQWIFTLDTIPYLELVGYLPDFLDGLFGYLSDPTVDVRTAALTALGEFLKEIRDVVKVQRNRGFLNVIGKRGIGMDGMGVTFDFNSAERAFKAEAPVFSTADQGLIVKSFSASVLVPETAKKPEVVMVKQNVTEPRPLSADELVNEMKNSSIDVGASHNHGLNSSSSDLDEVSVMERPGSSLSLSSSFFAHGKVNRHSSNLSGYNSRLSTVTVPYVAGQNVLLDIGRMVEILIPYLSSTDEETEANALRWINEFIILVREVMLPYTPMLLNAILPCLSHTVTPIKNIAIETNNSLYKLIADIPIMYVSSLNQSSVNESGEATNSNSPGTVWDPFEINLLVEALRKHFDDVNEETRMASLEWLLMLHKKAPRKIFNSDEATFQALLKCLSDASEEVVKRDLQLLAQISIFSDDDFFVRFLINLLNLFSTDRKLLESRGALIIRNLCLSLNPEKIYKTLAEILERDEVQNLIQGSRICEHNDPKS